MKKHLSTVHSHVQSFQEKHNVGYATFGLLTLFAIENNILAAYNLMSATM